MKTTYVHSIDVVTITEEVQSMCDQDNGFAVVPKGIDNGIVEQRLADMGVNCSMDVCELLAS